MKTAILTNGSISDYLFYQNIISEYNTIICADGGLKHAFNMKINPQVAIGDFDSTSTDMLNYFSLKGCKIVRYPSRKDETDTEIALDYAIANNLGSVDILAGLGTRFDHSLANVHLLKKGLKNQIPIKIITENNEMLLIDSYIKIEGEIGDGVSLLPLEGTVDGIYTNGLEYPIVNGELNIGKPYGVSNSMVNNVAEIKIKSGLLLVIKYRE